MSSKTNTPSESGLYDWLFHYNTYTDTWKAFHREDHTAFWNGTKTSQPVYEAGCFTSLLQKLKNHEC